MGLVIDPYRFGNAFDGPTPDEVTGLVLWLDAMDPTTFTFSADPLIQTWADKSGNGNDAGVDGAGTAPDRVTISGRQWVQFDGVDEFMEVPDDNTLDFGTGDFTIIVVYQSADTNFGSLFDKRGAAPEFYTARLNATDADDGDFVWAIGDGPNTAVMVETDQTFNDDARRSVTCMRDGTDIRLFANNVETTQSPFDATSVGTTDSTTPLTIGAFNQGGSRFLAGEIGEILIYDNAVGSSDLADIQAYLDFRWGM